MERLPSEQMDVDNVVDVLGSNAAIPNIIRVND